MVDSIVVGDSVTFDVNALRINGLVVVRGGVTGSDVTGVDIVEVSVDSTVGGARVSELPRVARLGFGVGTSVCAVAGRPVGVNAGTDNGAFVAPVVCEGVSLGSGVTVVVGNLVSDIGISVVSMTVVCSAVIENVVCVSFVVDWVVLGGVVVGSVDWVVLGGVVVGSMDWVVLGGVVVGSVDWVVLGGVVVGSMDWVVLGGVVVGSVDWVVLGGVVVGS